jgi:hypothetical protein
MTGEAEFDRIWQDFEKQLALKFGDETATIGRILLS